MRTTSLLPIVLLLLTGCVSAPTSIEQQNQNPLTASRFGDELADTMANFIINNDPITQDASVRSLIESEIAKGKEIAEKARIIQSKGLMGAIIQMKADVTGYVLYHENVLFLSSDFMTSPGPSLHLYLTTVVDPRDTLFPDTTAVDLGTLKAAYGPAQYRVPAQEDPSTLRTFVLYDTKLKLIYGFAQISKSGS